MLKKLTPNLMVTDVKRTVAFYQNILNFDVLITVPTEDGVYHWAMVQRDGIEIMFQSTISISQEIPVMAAAAIGGSMTLYIEVTDVVSIYNELIAHVEIVQDIHDTFYDTREFAFRDCNGYVLAFSQHIGFHSEGDDYDEDDDEE